MAIETRWTKAYHSVSPNELPPQMLARFQRTDSDDGQKISEDEGLKLWALYQHYIRNDYARLRPLPENHVLGEIKALKEIQELPGFGNTDNPSSPVMILNMSGSGPLWTIIWILGLFYGGIVYATVMEKEQKAKRVEERQSQIVDTIITKLTELDARKARGEFKSEEAYEKERRKIIESAIRSH